MSELFALFSYDCESLSDRSMKRKLQVPTPPTQTHEGYEVPRRALSHEGLYLGSEFINLALQPFSSLEEQHAFLFAFLVRVVQGADHGCNFCGKVFINQVDMDAL